ncbi:MAG: hypothetical protein ABFS05_01805 [Bacteroidota bacterium]
MTQEEIKGNYQALYLKYSAERDYVAKNIRRYGLIRIIAFLLLLIAVYFSSTWSWPAFGMVMLSGVIIFGFLVRKHSLFHRRKIVLDQLLRINQEEKDVMEWDFRQLDEGKDYHEENHLYAYDLDLFGRGSLFQYINRTSTITGRKRLANMLSYIEKDRSEIINRQEAIAELSQYFDWRQDFRVLGLMTDENDTDIEGLTSWVNNPPAFNAFIFKILIFFVPLMNLFVFLLSVAGTISFWHFLAYLTLPLMVAGIKHRKVNLKHNRLSKKYPVLKKYAGLFRMIEDQEFSSARMNERKAELICKGTSASKAIRNLARISNAFDTRLNLLAGFLMNVFFLWDIRQSVRLENWQKKYKQQLPLWFSVMGEIDAYVSFAGYHYNNPGYIFPEISEADGMKLEAEQLGHPLIHADKRVCNDFSVDGWGRFTILTGANMAGKSTFLRTVGVNMLLASSGAPVCARSMSIAPVDLVTSIHTIDSLADNESYFYAELKRLQMIIEMLKEDKQIFIILDEILKGTNSRDKQSGSKALIRQLVSLKASGIIATHDLGLGELEEQFPNNVQNSCFEIIIDKDKLDYDYLLKRGIAQNMNATILMERMGITVT